MPCLALHANGALPGVLLAAVVGRAVSQAGADGVVMEHYQAFLRTYPFRDIYRHDEQEFSKRRALFDATRTMVAKQNAQPGRSWTAAVTHFADYTPEEMSQLMGYRHLSGGPRPDAPIQFLGLFEAAPSPPSPPLPTDFTWLGKLATTNSTYLRSQGACGSCWSLAATTAAEMHAEIAQKRAPPLLSYMEIVHCAPNHKHCGGPGGCGGGTPAIAFAFIRANQGIVTEQQFAADAARIAGVNARCAAPASFPRLTVDGFIRLPQNSNLPLQEALVRYGPMVTSVDGRQWPIYTSGVFDSCSKDALIGHSVVVVGYGVDSGRKYWTLRNSWGSWFGESGHIRMLRFDGEHQNCGNDTDPQVGVGCDDGPPQVEVCGMCGILYEALYPVNARVHF